MFSRLSAQRGRDLDLGHGEVLDSLVLDAGVQVARPGTGVFAGPAPAPAASRRLGLELGVGNPKPYP